jgi:hypothetical protein
MKKIKEQIDYGNRRERMDPSLERKISSPESLYGSNPAMRKGPADVQRLVSSRFQKVAEKLSQATGIEDLSPRNVQEMLMGEMMQKVMTTMRIESRFVNELERLSIEASLEESETPADWFNIKAYLNRSPEQATREFRFKPTEDKPKLKLDSPDIDFSEFEASLEEEDRLELERYKRDIINALIQGAAKKGHYIFQKPDVKARLDALNPQLYQNYLIIMAVNDFLYFTKEQMIEMMAQTGSGVGGKVDVDDNDEDGDEGGEDNPDTKITAQGMIFPILCHEIIKGIEEAKGRYGLPEDPVTREKVTGKTDILPNEPMQLRIGPEIVEKLRFALPDEIYDNPGLINWFHIVLYQTPAQEFLKVIGDVISDDDRKIKSAQREFELMLREAKKMMQEYEEYKSEKDSDSYSTPDDDGGDVAYGDDDENDDDDDYGNYDDLFRDLGIDPPRD